MSEKLYHFCAMHQDPLTRNLLYNDGTIKTNADLSNEEHYDALKASIAENMDLIPGEKITLISLTVVG